jgi:FtsX extracellular domain
MALSATALSACTGDGAEPLPARVAAILQDAAATNPAPIEQRIRALPGVTDVNAVTGEQAYERFRESFKDNPDVIEQIDRDTLPASLEVTVTDGAVAEAVELVIGTLEGVDETVLAIGDGDAEAQKEIGVLVRLTGGFTREQRDAIEKLVRELPRTRAISFETADQAQDRLRKRCRGKGDLAASFEQVRPVDIPASFRFRLGPGGKIPQLLTLQNLDGVEELLFVPAEVV